MRTLTITVDTIDDDYDFNVELELIALQLREGFYSGADRNDECSYSYEIN
tara:strand:- start:48 stop:197 length:150 start_codon:yes stop_codon:yes gene_type:complete